jgi:hypothetical protein
MCSMRSRKFVLIRVAISAIASTSLLDPLGRKVRVAGGAEPAAVA